MAALWTGPLAMTAATAPRVIASVFCEAISFPAVIASGFCEAISFPAVIASGFCEAISLPHTRDCFAESIRYAALWIDTLAMTIP